jgi:hypothetical protein
LYAMRTMGIDIGNESTADTRHGAGAECSPGFKALVRPYAKETK